MSRLSCIVSLLASVLVAPGLERTLWAAPVVISGESADASPAQDVVVPISVRDAQGLGAVQFHVLYDAQVLEWKDAALAGDAGTGVVDAKVVSPGRVRIALILGENGLQGQRRLLDTHFTVLAQSNASSAIDITAARAWTQQDIAELLVETQPGRVQIVSRSALPLLWIGLTLAVVVGLAILMLLRRRRGGPTVAGS
ncbi:MAG: cohesin domain-containing protein [Vicinamibacterales bacterium]